MRELSVWQRVKVSVAQSVIQPDLRLKTLLLMRLMMEEEVFTEARTKTVSLIKQDDDFKTLSTA